MIQISHACPPLTEYLSSLWAKSSQPWTDCSAFCALRLWEWQIDSKIITHELLSCRAGRMSVADMKWKSGKQQSGAPIFGEKKCHWEINSQISFGAFFCAKNKMTESVITSSTWLWTEMATLPKTFITQDENLLLLLNWGLMLHNK